MTETKELTTIERAEQALGLATLRPQLEALVKKSANIQAITNPAGRTECHAALMMLKNQRIAIEKTGKEAREEATRYSKAVIAAEKTLVDILSPEENRLAAIRQEWDDARAAEKAEEERIERERVAAMAKRISDIEALPGKLFGASVEELTAAIEGLEADVLDDLDDVFSPDGQAAKVKVLERLNGALAERVELDRQAAELAIQQAQREEQARLEAENLAAERAAFEAEQAAARLAQEEANRKAEEARAEADRAAKEERDRQAAELAERQAELDRREREAREQAEADARERAQVAAEEQAARDAKAAQEAAERAELAAKRDAVVILVDMPDGSRWGVPMAAVIRNRADFVFTNTPTEVSSEDILEEVATDFMRDHDWALDWAANNMNWSDVVAHAYQDRAPAAVDYQEGWVNGEKRVITRHG